MSLTSKDDLLQLFHAEAIEQLEMLQADLCRAEADPANAGAAFASALRTAHGLKGNAAVAGSTSVERWIHNWESCAEAVVRGDAVPDPSRFDLLLRILDVVAREVERVCTGSSKMEVGKAPTLDEIRQAFGPTALLIELAAPEPSEATDRHTPKAPTVRVPMPKIESLLGDAEELMQIKAAAQRLTARVGALAELLPMASDLEVAAREHARQVDILARRLADTIRSLRMVPAETVFGGLSRAVRDAARVCSKHARLAIVGGELEVDRDLAEALKEPVTHLLRNAVAHGIEPSDERRAAGKDAEGVIVLEIVTQIGGLEVRVSDDGAGVDRSRALTAAVARGLLPERDRETIADAELLRLLFAPGLTTTARADAVSGRGLGLDAVRESIEGCGGTIELASEPGRGMQCSMKLPLTLSSMRVILATVGGETIAFPMSAVAQVLRIARGEIGVTSAGPAVDVHGCTMPLVMATQILGLTSTHSNTEDRYVAVVLTSGNDRAVVVVDGIEGQEDVVVRSLGRFLPRVPYISGAAVAPSGRIVPLAHVSDWLARVRGGRRTLESDVRVAPRRRKVLVVDDSITTRTLEKSILDAAGYDVDVATDGVDALLKLRAAAFDLVLSDVQMPRMDGVELAQHVKRTAEIAHVPVVLVSSLGSAEDRHRGLVAGAAAYISKSEFQQELLLDTLERLLS